jgi:Uma2 family endonuclease
MIAVPQYPRRYSITAVEYVRMAEAGVFSAETRLELMDGEIIEMAPIGSPHASVVNTLTNLLIHSVGTRAIVSVQNPVIVGRLSVPQPDLLVLKSRANRYFSAHPTADDVLLIVEVSDTSLRFDLQEKIPMYGRAGIAEAWLVDLEKRELHVFTIPNPASGYQNHSVATLRDKLAMTTLPTVMIAVADLFPA